MIHNLIVLFFVYVISWCLMAIGYSATASVGHHLSPYKAYILLPLIMQIFGASLIAVPASRLMISLGRKKSFIFGSFLGVIGRLMCVYSLYIESFWLLVCATLFIGMFNGFGEFIKYAAAELFDDENKKNRVISIIVSGGIVAAFVGPAIASYSQSHLNFFGSYTGPYLVVAAMCLTSLLLFTIYVQAETTEQAAKKSATQNVKLNTNSQYYKVLSHPAFILGSSMGVLAYLIMGIMMDAFPITMLDHGMEFGHTTCVLQWHMLAMFAPSVLTSMILTRIGFNFVAICGIAMNVVGITFALQGKEFFNFLGSLLFIGLGWNFMYIAGTSLIANIEENTRKSAEGFNNFLITASYAVAAPLAAVIVLSYGWNVLSIVALVLAIIAFGFVFAVKGGRPALEISSQVPRS